MTRLAIVLAALGGLAAQAETSYSLPGTQLSRLTLAADGCSRDTDCKGSRICQANACVDPAPGMTPSSLAPMPPPSPAPSPGAAFSTNNDDVLNRLAAYQIQLLQFQKLSLAGPIFTLVVAGAGLIAGGVFFLFGYYLFAIGAVIMANTALPLAIGLTWLLVNISYNARIDQAIREIRGRSEQLSGLPAAEPKLTVASF